MRTVSRHTGVALQFNGNLVTEVVRNLDDVSDSGPRLVQFADVAQTQLIAVHQFHVFIRLRKVKVRNSLLVQPNIPPDTHSILNTLLTIAFNCHAVLYHQIYSHMTMAGSVTCSVWPSHQLANAVPSG